MASVSSARPSPQPATPFLEHQLRRCKLLSPVDAPLQGLGEFHVRYGAGDGNVDRRRDRVRRRFQFFAISPFASHDAFQQTRVAL